MASKRLAMMLHVGSAGQRRLDEMGDLVGEVADDAAVDLRPEMRVAARRALVADGVETLVGAIEIGGGARADDLERGAVAVHQPVRPGPAVVDAADRAVLEIDDGVERVLVAGAEHLALLRIDAGDPRARDPLHRVDVVHAHVEEDRARRDRAAAP